MPSPAMRCGARPSRSWPSKTMLAPGSGAMKPVSRLYRVVLPAPFGPRMPTISPRSTEKLTFLTACRPPKCLLRFATSSKALIRPPAGRPAAGCRAPRGAATTAECGAWGLARAGPTPRAAAPGRRDQAVGQEEQDQDQRAAVDHQPPFAEIAQQLGQQHQQDGAADRAVDAGHAADVDHGDDGDRGDHGEQLRAHLQLVVRVHRAAGAGEGRADHQRGDLVEGDVDAGGLAGRLVAADGAQDQAPVRSRQRQQQGRDRHQHRQGEVVETELRADQRRQAVDALLAAGVLPEDQHQPLHDHRARQHRQREVRALQAQRGQADDHRGDHRHHHRRRECSTSR